MMMFIYEIQAFAYSDFEHYILLHEKQFTKIEFRKMIEKSRQKAKQKAVESDEFYWSYNYPESFIKFMKEDYGFVESEHLVAHVGSYFDDKCEVNMNEP